MVVFAAAGFLFCEPKDMQSSCGHWMEKEPVSITGGPMFLDPSSEVGLELASSNCEWFLWWHKIHFDSAVGVGFVCKPTTAQT